MVSDSTSGRREALEALERGDPDLEAMRARLERFNVFAAVGMGRTEIRHSNFLSFLLNPTESHGLRDYFAKSLLVGALKANPDDSELKPAEMEAWSLNRLQVDREVDNIDILLTDHGNRFVVVIENKTASEEHSDQLQRYRRTVERRFPGYRRILLFLTPEGEEPSDPAYIPVTYSDIDQVARRIIDSPPVTANPEFISLLRDHYLPLLQREGLVPDEELSRLAARVYGRYKSALDYIIQTRSQLAAIEELIRGQPNLLVISVAQSRVAFVPAEWKEIGLETREDGTLFGWRLLFQFRANARRLRLVLRLGPVRDDLGQRVIAMAKEAGDPFKAGLKKTNQTRVFLYDRSTRLRNQIDDEEPMIVDDAVQEMWKEFLERDLPRIHRAIVATLADKDVGERAST